jgi:hypothetical protein
MVADTLSSMRCFASTASFIALKLIVISGYQIYRIT